MKKNKKGISLIVLAITIVVIVVLAGTVIVQITKRNPMNDAKIARFKTNYQDLKTELNDNVMKALNKNKTIKKEDINETTINGMKKYMPSISKSFASKVAIQNGNLVLKLDSLTSNEKDLAKDVLFNIQIKSNANNPYIPLGFKHITGTVDTGFVIKEEKRGDEFVWIPVNNISEFEKVIFNNEAFLSLTDIGEGFKTVYNSVKKYGGFYVSRYEIGKDGDKLVSKKGKTPYVNMSVNKQIEDAANIYHRSDIQSSLMYGTNYDSMVTFLINTNPQLKSSIITGSQSIGNYSNAIAKTGSNESYKINNIYDLAGNVQEATLETQDLNTIHPIVRGGSFNTSSTYSIASRHSNSVDINTPDSNTGLRIMLYLK